MPVAEEIITDRDEDVVQYVFEQVEARRRAEDEFYRTLDEHTGEVS